MLGYSNCSHSSHHMPGSRFQWSILNKTPLCCAAHCWIEAAACVNITHLFLDDPQQLCKPASVAICNFFVCKAGSSAVFLSSFVVCMLGNMENSRQNPAGSPEVVKKYLLQYSRLHPEETRIMQCRKGCEQGCQSQAGHLEQQWKGCTVCLRYFWLTSCLFAASTPTSAPTAHDNTVTAASAPVPVLPLVLGEPCQICATDELLCLRASLRHFGTRCAHKPWVLAALGGGCRCCYFLLQSMFLDKT